jgi:ABC-2 type transport system permease protein
MQLTLGCVIAALIMWALSFIPAFIIHGNEMLNIINMFRIVNTLGLLSVAVGLAFLLGNVLDNKDMLATAIIIISMGLSFGSGVFVPQEFMSSQILTIARFFPIYWYIRVNELFAGLTVVDSEILRMFWEGLLVQFGFALALIAITLMVIRQKRMKAVV